MSVATKQQFAETAALIRRHEAGRYCRILTPFGPRLLTYADLTATGRQLGFVEEWIRRIGPYYANTHTSVSSTGSLFSALRESSREIIREAVHAGAEDEVLFTGSGATAAVNKLVGLLGLRIPEPLERAYRLSERIPEAERPVVLVGPYEHHSNLLPWTESIAEVVEVPLDRSGLIDMAALEAILESHARRPLKIGSFSAASNVTGLLSDVPALARLLHGHGAWAFFDFAAAAPYVPIDMHPPDHEARIDALFLSTHKFVGGPEGSGVLVANRALFRTATPERPGGGTVDYVAGPAGGDVDYVRRLAEREEGGTPAILGDLRAGAAFLVKEMLGADEILSHEIALAAQAVQRLARHPRIRVLGPHDGPRLAIVSLAIAGLHHDLASALLDHLFGIQNRAGCSCAGPYGHHLLGIDRPTSERFRALVRRGIQGIKPGWVRLSLPYYASSEDVDFMLSAVEFVADRGMDFVPVYRLDWRDGVWRHLDAPHVTPAPDATRRGATAGFSLSLESLKDAARDGARLSGEHVGPERIRAERADYFEQAHAEAMRLRARWAASPPVWNPPTGDAELDTLVWFRFCEHEGLPPAP